MSVSAKTCIRAAAFRRLPVIALIALLTFQGASVAPASEKEQGARRDLVTAPSVTPAPVQMETEQTAPENLITAPTVTTPPPQPEVQQTAPESPLTAPSITTPLPQPEVQQTAPENLITAPSVTTPPPQPETKRAPGGKEMKYVDALHSEIVRRLLVTAVWMDSFFADPDYVKEANRTYLRFRYEIFKEERSPFTYKPAVDFRLVLPEFEKKTHLIFSADPAVPPTGASAPVLTAGERFGTTAQNTITAGLQYIFHQDAETSFLIRTGFQFANLHPVILFAPRYRVLMPLDDWVTRFTQEVLWKSKGSWQTDTQIDFERPLPYQLFFRTSINGEWAAQAKGYAYSLGFSLSQPLTPTHAVTYEWINSYNTWPVGALTEIAFRIRYRHSYLREWLFFELAPQVRFPRDANFDSTAGILFKVEVLFGPS